MIFPDPARTERSLCSAQIDSSKSIGCERHRKAAQAERLAVQLFSEVGRQGLPLRRVSRFGIVTPNHTSHLGRS